MNRQILFKAKRKDNGEWVEGYLFDDGMPKPKHYFIGGIIVKPYEGTACDKWNVVGIDFCEIDINTLCQFTGLTDKNGKRIWENDIVNRTDLHVASEPSIGFIEYDLESTSFLIHWTDKVEYSPTYHWKDKLQVIGNIFDNAELLEGERC